MLARTRSLSFTLDYFRQSGPTSDNALGCVTWWCGDAGPVHYRKGTSDTGVIYDILFKQGRKGEYWLPAGLEPEVVLDIGANIGVTSRYLAHRFPGASIHAFEPVPDNLRVAEQNLAGLGPRLHHYGLGSADGIVPFAQPGGAQANPGSYSQLAVSDSRSGVIWCRLRAAGDALAALGVEKADVIKIDVEGAEHEILCALPDEILSRASWIYGELHTESVDPRLAFAALERLARWFDIEMRKPMRKRNWFFDACNRRISSRFRDLRRGH